MEEETPQEKRIVVGKRSLPKTQSLKKTGVQMYAYSITDNGFDELFVKNSANAWWMDKGKVQKLIDAYKIDCIDEEAVVHAGISMNKLRYFREQHPEFSLVKQACLNALGIKARTRLALEIEKNANAAYLYLEKKDARQEKKAEDNKEVKPNAVVFVDFGEPLPKELQEANQDTDHAESE